MFGKCCSLISLVDISKWDTSKVTNMLSIFSKCYSLALLPDISKWNFSNINNMNYMLYECFNFLNTITP